ncbi:ankyrin repeat domain-containing protein [Acidicapsa acidisoli]|uniref:ankyrin repeat domain-containing protein n=1 Tax=Acidicapsa acidisoli TaxID=1615681 RepID=UPI0021DF84FB|nr:ankyrin repeat domain-containing protein [Acidicapsa acidisoli]
MKDTLFFVLFAVMLCVPRVQAQSSDLFNAARADDTKTVQSLIAGNVDINQRNEDGFTALVLASYNGSPDVAELLLQHHASTEIKDPVGRTALMAASFQGDEKCVKLLIDAKADINAADDNGATSLMYAVEFGRKNAVKLLLAAKADPTMKDKRGFDAIYLAQQLDDPEMLALLKH